MKGSDR